MYHERLTGSHYDIGFAWGNRLKKNGVKLLSGVPFPITEQRVAFGQSCLGHYRQHFPEILEEIQGIADGNGCEIEKVQAVLFSMYCLVPSAHCSCFVVKKKGGGVLLGRNSDFLTQIEKLYMNTLYRFANGSFSFNGNTTAFVQMEDGVNKHGLAAGLTSVAPGSIQPGLNAGMILRLFLEKCKTVEQAVALLKTLPLATSQTLVIADSRGEAALVECSPQACEIVFLGPEREYACSTNMFNTPAMRGLNHLPPDTWQAEERYQTMAGYLGGLREGLDVEGAQRLLAGKEGFICQYDRKTGKDTVWSVVYDMAAARVYRAEGNPARKPFKLDERLKWEKTEAE